MMRNDCLAVLREMCFASACFSEGLSVQRQFLIRLFALMENKITFDYAVALAEEILAVGEETLNLGSVPNFARLVRGLSSRQLSFFCRVLAMVVFEPEDRAPEVSALQKGADPAERAEREAEWAVADGNHDVLLAIPDILANLVKLLQMESSGEADLWSPSLSEWQPLLGDLMAGEDETAADWGPEEDDEEDYNEDGEEYEEEEEQEEEEEEEELLEVEEEVDMEGGGGGAAREGRGGAGEGGEEQEPGPDSGGGAVAVGQRRTGAAAPAAGVAPREAADTTRGPFSPRSPPVAAPPPRMPPLLPPSPHAAVLPFSPHPTMLTGTSTSPPRPPPNRTPPTATQPGALPQVNTIGIPMTANPLNLLPLTAPANPAAATAAEAAGAGIPAGARVMVFVGNPPRLLGEVPEGELEPFLRALPQGAVTVLRAGEIGLPEGAGPAAVATNMAASFMEQQQVEVLFVLCALCGGKRKEAVQDQLAGLGLVAILVDSFDRLNWSAPLPPPAEPHGIHGPGCSCNPESALKIQYLRLIHNFCDRDGPNLHNKLLLASPGGVPPPLAAAAGTPTLIAASGIAASASTPGSTTAGGGAGGGATISGGSSSSSGSSGGVGGRVQASTQGEGNGDGQGQGEGEGEEQGYALGFGASLGRALGFSPNQWLPGLGMRDGAGDSGVLSQAVGVGSSRAEGSSAIAAGGGTEAAAAAGAGGVVEGGGGEEAKNEALMLKIIRVLMKESADSVYRFWLASCVEAFLRGSNPRDQQLVAATGLMEHLVEEILRGASGFKCAASLQIDFDLLGELVKFNPVLFRRLAVLVKGERFSRFIEGSVEEEEEELASPLAAFMECNSVLLLRDLMLVVRLGDINQDNICVLNTALIFFIFANRNTQLLSLLAALRAADKAQPASLAASTTLLQPSAPSSPASPSSPSSSSPSSSPSSRSPSFLSKPPSSALLNPSLLPEPLSSTSEDSSSGVGPGSVMKNFRVLLDFWREYYLRKRGRDCASLQFSTNIPFTEWLRVVEMLCAPPDCPTSLLYCSPLPASGSQCSSVGLRVDPPPRRC
ncbi:unnamed protein product [Closterium sp. Naga37s-1]|nr:unnamed protein product [Closterium sp. Naga37s-1]